MKKHDTANLSLYETMALELKKYGLADAFTSEVFFRHRPRRTKQQRKFERAYTPSRR